VLDQTGLPLPGATVQLLDKDVPVATISSDGQGQFTFDQKLPGDVVAVALNGFEPARVARSAALRIVLLLEHGSDTSTVVAPTLAPSSPATPLLGNTLTADNIARLPSSHMKATDSLPLLPSVVRGPDGLMQLGGAPAHETPLLLDGFNIADPATGISSLNLPLEAVKGVDVLRDPMSVTYGRLLGGLVALESKEGDDGFSGGVQGFVPRPRFANPGFGRLEGIFPRAFVSGGGGPVHYMAAAEYDYERIPVPGVTTGQGPDLVEESSIAFSRVDVDASEHNHITVEGLFFPGDTRSLALSPLRTHAATTDVNQTDVFGGIVDRYVPDQENVFTVQIGVLQHRTTLQPNGEGASMVSPAGWTGNWFATADRTSRRYSALMTWERVATVKGKAHDFTIGADVAARSLRGRIAETSIVVNDAEGRPVRRVDFGAPSDVQASDRPGALSLRDVWQASDRLQVDAGVRVDGSRYGGTAPSGRAGIRYALDESGATVVKAGYGGFVGPMPLAVPAFASYPTRVNRTLDPATGGVVDEATLQPSVGPLYAPRSLATTLAIERRLGPGLDAQIALTNRQSSRLATLDVPLSSGPLTVASNGTARYQEAEFSLRRAWAHDQQIFVSYVRSSSRGELNDFETLFQAVDAPLVQPGGVSRLPGDAPNRVLMWATVNLPRKVVVSPVMEWRSGFPYSVLDERYEYLGQPNSARYPTFFSTDMVVYKTFTVHNRSADFGVQLFNVTDHRNPRDVYAVAAAPQFGSFTNSVGTIVRGYMLLRW
jgi:hypothetical protein